MPQTKRAAQRKRRSKVVLALGAAGLSLPLGGSASAAIGGMNPDTVSQQVMLYEEEIADVSLATFHVFDKERAGIHRPHARLARRCGCALWDRFLLSLTPPVLGDPVDPPPPRPIRPAHKYKSNRTR